MNGKLVNPNHLVYDVTIVYPTYTKYVTSVNEPHISDEGGVPMLLTLDTEDKVHKFNMNKADRYEYKMVKKEEARDVK